MLNPRLKQFYEKVVSEDFAVLYNIKNVAKLPKLERAIVSSTSSSFGKYKFSGAQSFCAWRLCTNQKCVPTRARKSIAFFDIRKDSFLGLKVTLRKNNLFFLVDKILIFVLPKLLARKSQIKNKIDFENQLLKLLFIQEKTKTNIPFSVRDKCTPFGDVLRASGDDSNEKDRDLKKKHLRSALYLFLKKEEFLSKLSKNVLSREDEANASPFHLSFPSKSFSKDQFSPKTFFTVTSKSSIDFPETSSLQLVFDSLAGFSFSLSCEKIGSPYFPSLNRYLKKTNRKKGEKESCIEKASLPSYGIEDATSPLEGISATENGVHQQDYVQSFVRNLNESMHAKKREREVAALHTYLPYKFPNYKARQLYNLCREKQIKNQLFSAFCLPTNL